MRLDDAAVGTPPNRTFPNHVDDDFVSLRLRTRAAHTWIEKDRFEKLGPGDRLNNLASRIEALEGVTLKPWRVDLELMRLAEFVANRHPDLRQTLLV